MIVKSKVWNGGLVEPQCSKCVATAVLPGTLWQVAALYGSECDAPECAHTASTDMWGELSLVQLHLPMG